MSIPLIPTKNSTVGSATAPTAAQIPNPGQLAVNAFTGRSYLRTEGGNSVDPARVTLSGDVTGATATATTEAQAGTVAATVAKIQGRTVATTAPTSGQALTWNSTSSQWEPGGGTSMVGFNRIINGAMMIDQRNAGASVTNIAATTFVTDRFFVYGTQASKFSAQQNAGAISGPTGFLNYLGATSSSAYAVGTSELFLISQRIEGFNCSDLGWGAAGASSVTLSFWVRSNLTGTFGGSVNSNAGNYSYPFSYTISAANTWEQKSITISGPTAGTWGTGTNGCIQVNFSLGSGTSVSGTANVWTAATLYSSTGATSVVAGTGNTLYITGVQLEKGTLATSFDARPYGTELALCQRYYWRCDAGTGEIFFGSNASAANGLLPCVIKYPVQMRASPTITPVGVWGTANVTATIPSIQTVGTNFVTLTIRNTTTGDFYMYNANTSYLQAAIEL